MSLCTMLQLWTPIYLQKPENEAEKSIFEKNRCPKLETRETKLEMTSKITMICRNNYLRNALSFPPNYPPQQ